MARLHLHFLPPIWRQKLARVINRIKPVSTAWRTTLLVSLVSLSSLVLSMLFFWRLLYLPELRQHAHYLAVNLALIRESEQQVDIDPFALDLHDWVLKRVNVELVRDPAQFPQVRENRLAERFTRVLAQELTRELGEPVTVYFQYKPQPQLWIYFESMNNTWIREPLLFYGQRDVSLLLAWLIGVPLTTIIITLILVRQLNRPLLRLQKAAQEYTREGQAPVLKTHTGPIEIRQVNSAFNQMITTIERADADRKIMLAGISHDLRTPLTRIRLSSELMSDRELARGLEEDVDDMDAILAQFIDYMREGSDEAAVAVDVPDLITEVAATFRQATICYEPLPLPAMLLRPLSIRRLLGNLINNAIRYGAQPIEIATRLEQDQLLLTVRDHGSGVPSELLEKLLEPFVQGDDSRTRQGSGLGLAIVKRIVDQHQGKLTLANHPAGGLEVMISLPVKRVLA